MVSIRQVQVTYKGYRAIQDNCKGYEIGIRPLQGVRGRYKTPMRGTRQVQDPNNVDKVRM